MPEKSSSGENLDRTIDAELADDLPLPKIWVPIIRLFHGPVLADLNGRPTDQDTVRELMRRGHEVETNDRRLLREWLTADDRFDGTTVQLKVARHLDGLRAYVYDSWVEADMVRDWIAAGLVIAPEPPELFDQWLAEHPAEPEPEKIEPDELPVVACKNNHVAIKRFLDGAERPFNAGKWFATHAQPVAGLWALAEVLDDIQRQPDMYVVRGQLREGVDHQHFRRTHRPQPNGEDASFEECPRRWLLIDLDGFELPDGSSAIDVEAVGRHARTLLPPEFHGVACWAQLTGSAGVKQGGRVRLAFWLDRPVTNPEIKRWLKQAPVDTALYTPTQPHYVGNSWFNGSVADPVTRRSAVLPGGREIVTTPPPEALAPPPPPERPAPSAVPGGRVTSPWVERRYRKYADRQLGELAVATESERHKTCLRVACSLLGLAKSGHLDEMEVASAVKGVMEGCHGFSYGGAGRQLTEVDSMLDWAWTQADAWEFDQ